MSKRALATQEQALQAERLRGMARAFLLLAATVLSLGTVGLLAADQLYRPDAFVINQLKIKGRFQHLEPAKIENVIAEQELGNFFSIELRAIEKQVEQLAWVQNAEVRREWPDTLLIEVEEQRPVMRWGETAWVNSQGKVVELPNDDGLSAPITLNGHPRDARIMLERSLQWRELLAESGLELSGMRLSESHAYELELVEAGADKSFALQLGRRDVLARLQRFLMLYNTELNTATKRLQRVDARYPDGLAIKAKPMTDKEQPDSLAQRGDNNE